jgi:hypothetical protein
VVNRLLASRAILKSGRSRKQLGGKADTLDKSTFKLTNAKAGLTGQFLNTNETLVMKHVMGGPHYVGTQLVISRER